MASKKCPKCGEDNPAEAVMCWACYTPLSGSAVGMTAATASLGAKPPIGKSPVGVPPSAEEETQKKGIDPKVIGGIAFLLVGGVIAFLVNGGMGGGGEDAAITPVSNPPETTVQVVPPSVGVAPPTLGSSGGGGAAAVAPVPLPFTTVTPPNPQFATGTVGILIAADKVGQAAGFARFAKDQLSRNGKWKSMQVCVFSDRTTADAFTAYQGKRRGAPLTGADYAQLASSGVWATTPVFLESTGKTDRIYYPSKSPNSWWPRR